MALSRRILSTSPPDIKDEYLHMLVRREGVRFFRGALFAAAISLPFWVIVLLFFYLWQ